MPAGLITPKVETSAEEVNRDRTKVAIHKKPTASDTCRKMGG